MNKGLSTIVTQIQEKLTTVELIVLSNILIQVKKG
jgi:hypothetical protein